MTTTQTTTAIEQSHSVKIQRLTPTHYKMLSFNADRIYDLEWSTEEEKWNCSCPDFRAQKKKTVDPECKHCIVLRYFIIASKAQARATTAEQTALAEQTARESLQSQINSLAFSLERIADEHGNTIQEIKIQLETMHKDNIEVSSAHDIIIAELRYEKFPVLEKDFAALKEEFPLLKSMVGQEALDNDYFKQQQKEFNAKIESSRETQKSLNSSHSALIVSLKKESRDQQEQISQQAAELKELREAITCMQQEREQASALIQASADLIKAMQSQSQQAPAPQERKITISIDGDATVKGAATSKAPATRKPTIEKITLPNGNTAYKVDKKYTVRTDKGGKFSLSCDCPKGANGKICEHGKAVDAMLGATVDENEM